MSSIVIALGGNALGDTPQEQLTLVRQTAKPIVDLIEAGNDVIIVHGNGPQIGMINLAMQIAAESEHKSPEMPFPECGAMSQGYIGYHLQNAIREELSLRGIQRPVVTVTTQVIIDSEDPAFLLPTKPIGIFYSEERSKQLEVSKKWSMVEDAGRGWRRVVPSPLPKDIVEIESIRALVKQKHIVIAAGGGGIPVIENGSRLVGVSAVIDKDFASEKLAEMLNADFLIILTAVEKVALNYGKSNEKWLASVSVEEVKNYIAEGHFAPGSMLPKIEAAVRFAESKQGRVALITSLEKAKEGIEGKTGTLVSSKKIN